MKKILPILLFFISLIISAQAYESTIPGLNITAPTASGIASKIKSPSALSTGIPEIEIPFFSLATHNKNVSVNLGLSYHPNNTFMGSKASDVGLGWSLIGATNLIYREINQANGTPTNNYHFNFLGRSGTFQLIKEGVTLNIAQITQNRFKFFATETAPALYKFKIIDDNGTSYHFDTLDSSYYLDHGNGGTNQSFTSCYYLTSVTDVLGNELVHFDYQEDSYEVQKFTGMSIFIPVKSLKINKITSKDFGSIHLNYSFNVNYRKSYQDPFQLNSVELRNVSGKRIEKYEIQSQEKYLTYPLGFIPYGPNYGCLTNENQSKRFLDKILRYGSGPSYQITEIKYPAFYPGNNFEITDYWTEYPNVDPFNKCFPEEYKNPKYLGVGLLQSIKYPNGTEVKYTFEPNQYFVDKNSPDYASLMPPYEVRDREAQYFEDIGDYPFDVPSGQHLGFFTLPANPDEPDGYSYLFFNLAVGELYTNDPLQPTNGNYFVNGSLTGGIDGVDGYKKYSPGRKTFSISGTGGKGIVNIKRIRYKSIPALNYSTGKGVRIKKIEYLDNNIINTGLTRRYEYEKFDGSNVTSGISYDIDDTESVVYKNVKETIGQNNGYTKYYYRTIFDPYNSVADSLLHSGPELKHSNVLKDGLLEKREVFNVDHSIVQKDSIISNIVSLRGAFKVDYFFNGLHFQIGKNGLIKDQKTVSTLYTPSGNYSNTKEIVRQTVDYNVIYEKNVGADGTITESNITYPWNRYSTEPKLWSANITTVPISVETKKNGTVISKSETKFDSTAHFYPTSQLSFMPDNLNQSLKNTTFDIYDDKGNLVQFTVFPDAGSGGVPTTIIYGYNKTLPIAKIEGAKLSDIPSNLITTIVNASNEDGMATLAQEEAKEQALIAALNTFKNDAALQNFMITCYTYNPLIGITTTIPPNGLMELYKYDSFNRLLKTVDVNGNIIKEHKYNYKN